MKKYLAIILALIMLLSLASLAACGEEKVAEESEQTAEVEAETTTTGAHTKEELEASKPCEFVQEKLDAGMEVLVGYSTLTLDNSMAYDIHVGVRDHFEELGFSYYGMECESNDTKQIEQIENFVQMKAACLLIGASDPNVFKDCITAAEEAGTRVVYYGAMPDYTVSGICMTDLEMMGKYCGYMASDWVSKQYPDAGDGEIDAAVLGYAAITEINIISQGIKDALAEDSRINIVYVDDECLGIDDGFTAVETAFTACSTIKLVAGYDMSACIGAANYIATIANGDFAQYGVFTTNTNSEIETIMENSKNNEGCLRGTIMGSKESYEAPFRCMYDVLFNEYDEYPHVIMEPLNTINSTGYEIPA